MNFMLKVLLVAAVAIVLFVCAFKFLPVVVEEVPCYDNKGNLMLGLTCEEEGFAEGWYVFVPISILVVYVNVLFGMLYFERRVMEE